MDVRALILLSISTSCTLANAELQRLNEIELSDVSGQAGIDIGISFEAHITDLVYTDTDDGGSLHVNDLHIGGANKSTFFGVPNMITNPSAAIDEFFFSIDVRSNGDMTIIGSPTVGNVIDFHITSGPVYTSDSAGNEAVRILDSLSIVGLLGGFAANVRGSGNQIAYSMDLSIEDMDINASSNGIVLNDIKVVGHEYFEEFRDFGTTSIPAWFVNLDGVITTDSNGLTFDLSPTIMDVAIGDFQLGGASVGSFEIDNFSLNDVSIQISGH